MFEGLTMTLLFSFVGMGLVFGAIVFFWALTAILARITRDGAAVDTVAPVGGDTSAGADDQEIKRRAALAAVSVALALQAEEQPQPFPLPPPALVSTWQAVQRARLMGRGRWGRRR
mgnify:CR=1 FL=1